MHLRLGGVQVSEALGNLDDPLQRLLPGVVLACMVRMAHLQQLVSAQGEAYPGLSSLCTAEGPYPEPR